jgi:signal transduction histidine kinase
LPVRVDRGMVEQIVLNLALNARDAMPSGGNLDITLGASDAPLEDPFLVIEPPAEAYAVLEVSDTGTGMTPEVKARIFEPFFTTKESGKGTGLGLPVVFGAVRQCRGAISLESEPGRGTRFRVAFALDAPKPPAPEPPPRAEEEAILT